MRLICIFVFFKHVSTLIYRESGTANLNSHVIVYNEEGVPTKLTCVHKCLRFDADALYNDDMRCTCVKKNTEGVTANGHETITMEGSYYKAEGEIEKKEIEIEVEKERLIVYNVTLGRSDFGRWSKAIFCPPNVKVSGMRIQGEPEQGSSRDNAGLTGVQLACSDGSRTKSISGKYGSWTKWEYCGVTSDSNFFIQVFATKSEGPGKRDNTGINVLKLLCKNGPVMEHYFTDWGLWDADECPDNSYLCGLRGKVDWNWKEVDRDVTGINKLRFYCCAEN